MTDYTIKPEAFPDSTVEVTFSLVESSEWRGRRILIVHFSGKYGFGSQGNPDAEHMRSSAVAAIDLWEPDALVLDLTQLHYEWGDLIDIAIGGYAPPTAIVVGPNCREALASLFGEDWQEQRTYDSIDSAIEPLAAAMWEEASPSADPGEFPCSHIAKYITQTCDQHPDPWDCPDAIIIRAKDGRFGIPVRDGGSSFIEIRFCPWCAAPVGP